MRIDLKVKEKSGSPTAMPLTARRWAALAQAPRVLCPRRPTVPSAAFPVAPGVLREAGGDAGARVGLALVIGSCSCP